MSEILGSLRRVGKNYAKEIVTCSISNYRSSIFLFRRLDSGSRAVVKRIKFGETRNLELRGEVFNLLNTPNFDLPNAFADSAQFGKIFSAGPARQIQFGVKFDF